MEQPPPLQPLLPLQSLERDLAALRAAWFESMPAFGAVAGSAQVEVEQMSDAGLVAVTDLIAQVRRDADALLARVAAELAKRSGPEFGDTGLAKAQGFHNPVRLIAASTGASRGDADVCVHRVPVEPGMPELRAETSLPLVLPRHVAR